MCIISINKGMKDNRLIPSPVQQIWNPQFPKISDEPMTPNAIEAKSG